MKSRLILALLLLAIIVFWLFQQTPTKPSVPSTASIEQPVSKPAGVLPVSNLSALPPAMATFREWSDVFINAPLSEKPALLAEGQAFAKEHTKELAKLIKTDPQAAIAHAVPMVVRQKLPPEIVGLLEERPRLRGDYEVYGNVPLPGQEGSTEPYTRTVISSDGKRWNAYVYGKRQMQRSMTNVSLNGVSVARDMAVSDSPVRVLEVGELPLADGRQVVDVCPVSGIETEVAMTQAGAPPPVTEETPAFETPEQVIYVCSGGHISQMAEQYLTDEEKAYWASLGTDLNSGAGSGPAHGPVGTVPGGWTTGHRTFLYIRATFPDNPVDPQNEQECYDMLKQMNDYIVQTSYGRCYFTYAVPPLIVLPYPLAWYNRYDADVGGGDYLIQTHARQIARSMGYDNNSFNLDAVRWSGGPGSYGGSASVGGRGMRMKTSFAGTFCHELGHNLGVWHANFWRTTPPSFTGPGNNLEYGNLFDLMGNSGSFGQYTASFKNTLSWMPQEQFWNVTSSGLYRIHQTDDDIADPSLRYALRIRRDSERDYWAEFRLRHPTNVGFTNGLMMTWDQWGLGGIGGSGGAPLNGSNRGAQLLDMTPGSFGNGITDTRNDSALWVGRTFSDPDFNIHFTPIAKNASTTPPSMDVFVQVGNVPGNNAPTLAINASTTTAVTGANVTLTATASDPDSDTLAYSWVFGDGTYSVNNGAVQTKSWASAGHYQVLCTASDMKGKRTTRSVLITVGAPTTFTVSGSITDPSGQPLEGVYVANYAPSNNPNHGSSGSFRGTWTDSAGNYTLTGISAGSYTITPTLYPLTFAVSGFANPVTVGPNSTGKNFTSTSLPAITISYPDDTANEAAVPGPATIRLNRAGSTTSAVSVQIYNTNTGSATRNTDYALTPAPASATSPDGGSGTSQYIIPAGASFLDITLTPVNDGAAEGIEYASLDFVNTASGYIMAGNPRAVVPIIDDESSLPVVKITSVDDSGHEAGTDTLTMKLERTGVITAALNVNLTYTGMATNVTDYAAPASVTIPANSASTTFTLTPVNDTTIETTETIIATLATNAAYLRDGTAQSVTSILNDDDMPTVTVATTDAAAGEAGSDKGLFTITRTGEVTTSLTVDYSVNGRAVLGTDYRRLDGRAVIPAGSTSITVEIVPFDDALDEGPQDVILQLRTAQNYVIGGTGTGTVNIADNDASQVYVELNTGAGLEPASGSTNGPVFQITRPASGSAITVNYSITGTATSGTDFTALPGTISFAAADTSRTIIVSMLADTLMENAESVTLTLLPGTGYTLMQSQFSSMTAWIFDGDQEVVDVNVADGSSALTTHIAETTSTGEDFLISRRTSAAAPLTVNYTISGTATSGADFTPLSGSATIPANATSVLVTVFPVNDSIAEGVESIIMTLTPASGTYGVRFGSATMLMGDNDAFASGSVGFATATASTAENIGTYNLPVNIGGTPPGAVSVRYRVNGGTAAGNGIDFILDEGVLNYAVGESSKSIPIAINHDLLPEPDETIVLQLFNATGANLGTSAHTLTLQNRSMPEAFSDIASGVTSTGMTFNGRVMPGGLATTYWFEYGGTTAYGSTTPVQNLAAGNTSVNVSAIVTGLTLSSYHFRLVAQNSLGTTYGIDQFPGIISTPPVISEHPQDLAVNVGDPAEFTVFATGGGLSYQWQKGTTDIGGATAATYTIPVTTLLSAGNYRCVVTNADGTANSNPAALLVISPPMITQHPSPQNVVDGATVSFSVMSSGLFLSYQWQKDGEDLPGKTESTLLFTDVDTSLSGQYRCIVSNSAGSDTSNAAALFVDGPPTMTREPVSIAVKLGDPATFGLLAAGPGLTYQWQKEGSPNFVNVDGATSASFTIPAADVSHTGNYRCRVGNTHGIISSATVTLSVVAPPQILTPTAPTSVTLNEKQPLNLSVTASGLFLSYQWHLGGGPILGATGSTYSVLSAEDSNNGVYTCVVSNAAGEATSPAVTVLVITPPVITAEPEDTFVAQGQPVTLTFAASGPQLAYQWWHNGLPITNATNGSHNIAAMAIANIGVYHCKVTNSAGTATTRYALVGIEGMPLVTRAPYSALIEAGSPLRLEVEATGADLSYTWKQNGKQVGTGAIFEAWPATSKHAGLYVAEVKNTLRTTTTQPVNVTTVTDMSPALDMATLKWSTTGPAFWRPAPGIQAKDGKDALSSGNLPHGHFASLSTRVTGPLVLNWWQKISTEQDSDYLRVMLDGTEASSTSGIIDWQAASLTVPAGVHQIDFVYVKDGSGSGGLDRVWLDLMSTSPASEPTGVAQNRLVGSGTTVALDAAYTGPTPDSFQWRRNGGPVAGAISAHWDIVNVQTSHAGTYDCILTSMVNGEKMTRLTPPVEIGVVEVLHSRHVVSAGTVLPLIAKAVGKNLTYQWRRSTGPLEASSKINITLHQTTYSDDYICAVTNAAGTVDAGIRRVDVFNREPEITLDGDLDDAVLSGPYRFQVPVNPIPAFAPTGFTAKGLPKGLVIDKVTGLITGIPEESSGTVFPITITAFNSVNSDTVETSLFVHGLSTKTGIFTGPLGRNAALNQGLGGRIDLVITANGSFSGTLSLGALKHSFKSRIVTATTNLARATASFDVARGKDTPVRVTLLLTDAGLMSGTLTLGTSILIFDGWKVPWTKASPATAFVGTQAPVGSYNFALPMPPAPALADASSPQGTGFGTFIVARDTGITTITGRLPDDSTYTASSAVGALGQMVVFTALYTSPNLGSLQGQLDIAPATNPDDNTLEGRLSWWRPTFTAAAKQRLDPDGFEDAVVLEADGARYIAPVAPELVLGLAEAGPNTAALSFLHGGIGSPPPTPDITITLGKGSAVTYPALNPRKTTLSFVPAKGTFTGSFTLEDNDPLDLRPPPAVLKKLPRKVTFNGLLMLTAEGWQGVGSFQLPELPDVTGETLTTTPVHAGSVLILPDTGTILE
jgi:hypothetical protein